MNLRMGSQVFVDVQVPLLWGTRAILQDPQGRLSVINLAGDKARLEILADRPAPDIPFIPRTDGFVILEYGEQIYVFNQKEKLLEGIGVRLPPCQVTPSVTRVGTNSFSGNVVSGFGVGIHVTEKGMSVGAPLPPGLAKLSI